MNIKEEKLKEFLIKAKKSTYANSGAPKIEASRLNSHDYQYEDVVNGHKMIYHDTYFGGINFMGEEIVYVNSTPFWGMNYYGVTLDDSMSEEAMDKALRPALMRVGMNEVIPVRGPKSYKNEDYVYTFDCTGDINNFSGIEQIRKNNKLIYELHCNGGLIK